MAKTSLYQQIGGMDTLRRVHKVFYDKVYAHPWLGRYFADTRQDLIEEKQSRFMAEKMGAEDVRYIGHSPELAHRRMYISDELFDERQQLLRESLEECGVEASLIQRWLKIDGAFRRHIVNESLAAFEAVDLGYEQPVNFSDPRRDE